MARRCATTRSIGVGYQLPLFCQVRASGDQSRLPNPSPGVGHQLQFFGQGRIARPVTVDDLGLDLLNWLEGTGICIITPIDPVP